VTGRLATAASAVLLAAGTAGAGKPPLPPFLAVVQGPLDHYGIWAVGLLMLLENIGLPVIPGELALIAGAIYAGTGDLTVIAVGVTAVIAAVVGSESGYFIGRLGGRALVLRFGKYVFIREHHLDRAERAVGKYGGFLVVVARFIVGLRELNGLIAGVTGMRVVTFTTFNVVGAVAWVGTWVTLGYLAGDHIDAIYADVTRYFFYAVIAAAVALAVWIGLRVRAARRRRAAAGDAGEQVEPQASDRS
jgi:membrane protein DedA with SNARE-associated domain